VSARREHGGLWRRPRDALARTAGLAREEIAGMPDETGRPGLARVQLSDRADALDQPTRRWSALRDGLRHAAACPAPSHMECPTFRGLLKDAIETRRRTFVEDLG